MRRSVDPDLGPPAFRVESSPEVQAAPRNTFHAEKCLDPDPAHQPRKLFWAIGQALSMRAEQLDPQGRSWWQVAGWLEDETQI